MAGQKSEVDELDPESTVEIDVDVDFIAVTLFRRRRRSAVVRPNVNPEGRGVEAERRHLLVEREDRAERELVERRRQNRFQKVEMVVKAEDNLGKAQRDLEKEAGLSQFKSK